MNTLDFSGPGIEGDLDVDLCVVGSGPAGLSLAREFAGSGVTVLVVESGGLATSEATDRLNDIDSVGAPLNPDRTRLRSRVFGGTSEIWSGRCAPFDAIDYEKRDWLPHSGWPITASDVAPFLGRASTNLGLGPPIFDDTAWAAGMSLRWYSNQKGVPGKPSTPAFDRTRLRPVYWQFSKHDSNPRDWMRFGPWFRQQATDNIRLLLNATVTGIELSADLQKAASITISAPGRPARQVRAKAFALCAGGVENPRLLLASRAQTAAGIGNGRGLVGRYLMDHPRTAFATVAPKGSERLRDIFCNHRLNDARGAHFFLTGFGLATEAQRSEKLTNCSAWLIPDSAPDNPWDALRRLRGTGADKARELAAIAGNARVLASGAARLAQRLPVHHKLQSLSVFADVEQRADPDSRITLSDRTDAFGTPLPRIDWRIGNLERETVRRLGLTAAEQFGRLGLPQLRLADWVASGDLAAATFADAGHPSGGTRMADDPASGVVDADCQVHGVAGLYVSGGSVLPTNSHANPTLMIVAMAIRLADHIKARHFA
jgi:choline dehydrogenase-like flavoprotein